MELLPEELRRQMPSLYSQENTKDPVVHCKFFTPDSNWTWFATEGQADEDDFRFFGYVIGFEEEWGYFVLFELGSARGPLGLPIERDLYFRTGPFSEVIKRYRAERGDQGHFKAPGRCRGLSLRPSKNLSKTAEISIDTGLGRIWADR